MKVHVEKYGSDDKKRCSACNAPLEKGSYEKIIKCSYCGTLNENPFYEEGMEFRKTEDDRDRPESHHSVRRQSAPSVPVIGIICVAMLVFGGRKISRDYSFKRTYDQALVCVENGEYTEAIELLEEINPKWSKFDKVERLHDKAMLGVIKDRINTYFNDGKYLEAMELIEQSVQDVNADQEIYTVYTNAADSYRTQVMEDAEKAFDQYEFDEAIQIVYRGLKKLSDDPELTAAKEHYETYKPVNLLSLTPYTKKGSVLAIGNGVRDTMGNEYETGLEGNMDPPDVQSNSNTGECSLTWDIGGKYDRLIATGIIPECDKGIDLGGIIRIYGDGVLLYEKTDITSDLKPYPVEVDISGIIDLKIEIYGRSTPLRWNYTHTTLVDIYLQKLK